MGSPAAFVKQQEKLLASMTDKTREAATLMYGTLTKENSNQIKTWYNLGKKITTLLDANKTNVYGVNVAQQLAEYLPGFAGNKQKLYGLRDFAATFELDYVEAKTAVRMASKDEAFLSITHWTLLTKVENEKTRLKLVDKTIEDGLSTRDLAERIRSDINANNKRNAGAGRPMSAPRTPMAAISLCTNLFTKFTNTITNVTDYGLVVLHDADASAVTREHLDAVVKQRVTVETVLETLNLFRSNLETLQPELEQKLAKQQEDAEAAAAAAVTEANSETTDPVEMTEETLEGEGGATSGTTPGEEEAAPAPVSQLKQKQKAATPPVRTAPVQVAKPKSRAALPVTAKPSRPPMVGPSAKNRPQPAGVA